MNIISPLFVMLPRKTKSDKRISLNLNVYRNLHFQLNNQAKIVYKNLMKPQLEGLKLNKISLEFVLYKASKRVLDRANILCIIEKFFCDTLVELNCLIDDNDEYIVNSVYRTGGIDKDNPRVEIFIKEVNA